MTRLTLLLAPFVTALPAIGQGQIIIVDDVPDVADFPSPQTVAQLPGPDGRITLREALIAANNTPGAQTIHFNVPIDRWPPLYDDRVLIYADFDVFPVSDDSLTIDGRSQTAFTGDTNPNGNEVAFWGQHPNALGIPLFYVTSDYNTFRGLDVMHRRGYGIEFWEGSEHNRVMGNTIDGPLYAAVRIVGSNNTVGGTEPGEANELASGNDGVRVESAFQTAVPAGNRIIGNYLSGSAAGVRVRAGAVGTVIGGPTPAERNVIADAGRFGSEGFPGGSQVAIEDASGTLVEGNYIGLTADGTASSGQRGPHGVFVGGSTDTVIRSNVIGGMRIEGVNHHAGQFYGVAVEVTGASDNTLIVGNRIGTSADGMTPIPNLNGIRVGPQIGTVGPTNTTIGGTDSADANTVAHGERVGISVTQATTGVAVLGNSVFQNGQLGIDLAANGGTPNDAGDADEGPNRLQNHPVLQSALLNGDALTVSYSVDTAPAHAAYPLRVEFFLADASEQEGAVFLGADAYPAPGSRDAVIDVTGMGVTDGTPLVATATDAAGNTSEFSAVLHVAPGTATAGDPDSDLREFALSRPAPNPASADIRFTLEVPEAQHVLIELIDALGRRVAIVHEGTLTGGTSHTFGLNAAGLPSGPYLLRATGYEVVGTRRITVLR
jgi:hypothetical protein